MYLFFFFFFSFSFFLIILSSFLSLPFLFFSLSALFSQSFVIIESSLSQSFVIISGILLVWCTIRSLMIIMSISFTRATYNKTSFNFRVCFSFYIYICLPCLHSFHNLLHFCNREFFLTSSSLFITIFFFSILKSSSVYFGSSFFPLFFLS